MWAPELHSQWECGHLATHSQWKWTAVWASGPHSQREWMTVVFGTSPAGRVRAGLSAPKRPKVAPKRANVLATCSPGQGDPNDHHGRGTLPPHVIRVTVRTTGSRTTLYHSQWECGPLATTLSGSVTTVWAFSHHSKCQCGPPPALLTAVDSGPLPLCVVWTTRPSSFWMRCRVSRDVFVRGVS